MKTKDIIVEAVQNNGTAVVGWGRGMGHKGHMLLARAVIVQAEQMGAQPLFFVSQTMGKDDPLTPEEKLGIYKKVFPKYANIFQTSPGIGQLLTEVAKSFPNVVLVLGEDQVNAFQFLVRPDKSGNVPFKTYGLNNLQIIARQQVKDPAQKEAGPRATPMREVLLDPNATDEQKFAMWRRDMPDALSDRDVMSLMKKAQQRLTGTVKEGVLGFMVPQQQTTQAKKPVDDFEARLIANREKKKQEQQNKEKVYHGKHEYWADKGDLEETRILPHDAKINAYYVSDKGIRHRVAENIPYYLLDKLIPLLTKKYAITMRDIEIRPTSSNEYKRTSQPGLAEAGGRVPSGLTWQGGKLQKRPELVAAARAEKNRKAAMKRKADKEKAGQEKEVTENSMADFFAKKAQEKFPHATIRKNGETIQEPPKREVPPPAPQAPVDVEELKQRLAALEKEYEQLGGDSWQYADRMMDRDREARDVGMQIRYLKHKLSTLAEGDPGYDKHSFIGKIRRGHEANNKGWGQLGALFAAGKDEEASRKALRKGNRYYNMSNKQKGSHTDGGFPRTTVPGLGKVDEADAATASTRASLAKRKNKKPLSPEEQLAKDKAKSDKWLEKERAKMAAKKKQGLEEIAGAFPSPSTREKWAKDAAISNAAEAKRQAALAAQADAERLQKNTEIVDKEQKVNHHSLDATIPANEDWQKTNKQDKTDGMSPKAVKAYRRENPGSKLKTAVTTKPSKLKAGSKDAKRRKSFCARMSGVEGPMKDEKGRPTPKAKALSRWNCNESVDEARMSAQSKLQRAFQREMEKSEASRKRGEELLNPKKEEPKKEVKESLANLVNRMRPLMAEATVEQKVKMLKLMKEAKVDLGAKMQKKAERLQKKEDNPEDKEVRGKRDEVSEDNDPCWKGYKQIGMKNKGGKKVPNCVPTESKLNEFAPGGGDEGGDDDALFKYAKMWYNGNLATQNRVAEILDKAGWEIGELESEEGGAFVVQSGDENGNTYTGWSAQELSDEVQEASHDYLDE